MSERMISREDADILNNAARGLIDDLKRLGFDPGYIGTMLASKGIAMIQVHVSHDEAMKMVAAFESLLIAEDRGLQ